MKAKQPSKLVPFDVLKKTSQDEKTSLWQGSKGTYVFESVPTISAGQPIKWVYLNRQYLSGLFKTKKPSDFSADVKEPDRRRYLIFRVVGADAMEVLERLPG
jgi:hypothetical protein